ncbi:MAG: tetratricopeptide repeat protein [Deltaproteobacteria bacterium]|nr:tetratricopeptide repeat protein [Deltaproteobacteria bacterium]
MINKIFNSFVPLLTGFIVVSFFLVWSHFSIEDKSNRSLLIEIPRSAQATQTAQQDGEGIRVLYPLYLLDKGKTDPSSAGQKMFAEQLKGFYSGSAPYSLQEQNDILARLLSQNSYKDAEKTAAVILKTINKDPGSPQVNSTVYYNLGILALIQDDYLKSIEYLGKIQALETPYLKDLATALALLNLKKQKEADPLLAGVLEQIPKKSLPLIHFKLGNLYDRLNEYQKALDEFDKTLSLDATLYQAKLNKAVTLKKMKRYKDAERVYAELLTERPSYFKGIYNYGLLLEKVGRIQDSIRSFEKALSLNLKHNELREKLASILFANKLYPKSLRHYRWLMKESPGNWDYILMVARIELKLDNYVEAIKLMKYAIEKKGGNFPDAWLELGDAYLITSEDALALKAYQSALRLEPKNQSALGRLAKYYSRMKNYDKEVEYYQRALKINPDNGLYLRRLGIALLGQKKIKLAIGYLEESLKNVSNPYRSYKYLGKAYDDFKDYKKASQYFEEALKLEPKDDLDWYHYGSVLYKLKDYEKAMEAFRSSLRFSDQEDHNFQALVKRKLANVYVKLKQFTPAINTYREVLELRSEYFAARLDYAALLLRLKSRKEQGKKELIMALSLRPNSCKGLKLAKKQKLEGYSEKWSARCGKK